MDFLATPTLQGDPACLGRLASERAAEPEEAVAEKKFYKLWYTRLPPPEGTSAEIEKRLTGHAAGQILPRTIRDVDGREVGMATFLDIRPGHRHLEICSTWIAPVRRATG